MITGALRHIKINGRRGNPWHCFSCQGSRLGDPSSRALENEENSANRLWALSISYDAVFHNQDARLDVRVTIERQALTV